MLLFFSNSWHQSEEEGGTVVELLSLFTYTLLALVAAKANVARQGGKLFSLPLPFS